MKIQELHKAVLTAMCQAISSDSADSAHLLRYDEDGSHIEAVFTFEHSSSYERLQNLSAILCRYGFVIGKISFGKPTEIHIISWIPECRFKTAIAEACAMFGLFTEDDQTIKDLEDITEVGQIIACAMKHKEVI